MGTMDARHFTGFVSLADDTTGQVLHVAVIVAITPDDVTYTAQSIDRQRKVTIQAPRQEALTFVRMMNAVVDVAAETA